MIRTMLAACAALALAGCATTSSSNGGIVPPLTSPDSATVDRGVSRAAAAAMVRASQGLVLAELAYDGAVTVTTPLVEAGLIKGAAATRLRSYNQLANKWLEIAHNAKSAAEIAAAVAQANDAILAMRAIAPSSK